MLMVGPSGTKKTRDTETTARWRSGVVAGGAKTGGTTAETTVRRLSGLTDAVRGGKMEISTEMTVRRLRILTALALGTKTDIG
jgi:hypothetical protein